jgi:DNA repair protein RecO (recombination protein O)
VQLTPAFLLHQRPFRDTSLIVEIYSRDYGRLTTFARGARGPGSHKRFSGLRPFQQLLVSWHGRGEAPQLIAAEPDGVPGSLPPALLMHGFYCNELLLKLTPQHDPQPGIFRLYQTALHQLAVTAQPESTLREFERQLLELLGFGLELTLEADSGEPVRADRKYRYHPGSGVTACQVNEPAPEGSSFRGELLLRLGAGEPVTDPGECREARALMRMAIDHCLEGRPLRTRAVARSMARVTAQTARATSG